MPETYGLTLEEIEALFKDPEEESSEKCKNSFYGSVKLDSSFKDLKSVS